MQVQKLGISVISNCMYNLTYINWFLRENIEKKKTCVWCKGVKGWYTRGRLPCMLSTIHNLKFRHISSQFIRKLEKHPFLGVHPRHHYHMYEKMYRGKVVRN